MSGDSLSLASPIQDPVLAYYGHQLYRWLVAKKISLVQGTLEIRRLEPFLEPFSSQYGREATCGETSIKLYDFARYCHWLASDNLQIILGIRFGKSAVQPQYVRLGDFFVLLLVLYIFFHLILILIFFI